MAETLRVLHIEDDDIDALWVKRALADSKEASFELFWVKTLSEGLREIKERSYDAVILDLNLPDAFGIEGINQLTRVKPDIPIVLLTGTVPEERIAVQAIHLGVQDYLNKGRVDEIGLSRSLRYAMGRKDLHLQLEKATREAVENQKLVINILENHPDAIVISNQQGEIRYANPLARQLFNLDAKKGSDKPRPFVVKQGEKKEFQLPGSEGTVLSMQAQAIEVTWQDQENCLLTNIHDISDQKQAQESLAQANRELKLKIAEVEKFNAIMMGREKRIVELKQEIQTLKKKS